jgi:glycosyltransferase involved in cell wall biosynthesis
MFSLLFVDTERVWRGGQNQLLSLIKGLHRHGHKIHLICEPQTLLEARALALGVFVHPMAIRSEAGLISLFRLIILFRKIRPQILAFNTPKAVIIGTLASRLAAVSARIVFRRVNFPLRNNLLTRIKYLWGIDCIVAISESIRAQLTISGIPVSRIRTIYEGLDLSRYPRGAWPKKRIAGEPTVVGTISHLSTEKGIQYLVEAASLIPGVHRRLRFVVVGDGSCRPQLEAFVGEKGLKDVFQFTGFQQDTSQFIKSFDMFALPSLSEGLSSSILEAMATSLPIVATNVGGIPELVKHGDNGFLVPPADPAALAQAIQQLADDPKECWRMGLRGRERVEKQFTLERKVMETEKLCSILLKESARPLQSADA